MRVLCLTLLVVCVGLSSAASANLQEKKRLLNLGGLINIINDLIDNAGILVQSVLEALLPALRDILDAVQAFLAGLGALPDFLGGGVIRDILVSLLGQELTDAIFGIPIVQQLTNLVDYLVAYLIEIIFDALYEVLDALQGIDLTDAGSLATFLQSVSIIAICLLVDFIPALATVVGNLGITCS